MLQTGRSVTSCGLPGSSTTQGLPQPRHGARAALGSQDQSRHLPNRVQAAGFPGVILSFLTSCCCSLPSSLMVLLLYKKIRLMCFFNMTAHQFLLVNHFGCLYNTSNLYFMCRGAVRGGTAGEEHR